MMLTPKDRLLRVLTGEPVDRPPVVCPGGPMSTVVADVLAEAGHDFAAAHTDPARMAHLARETARLTGFELVGVPLCATVEAEVLGAPVDLGSNNVEPRVVFEPYASVYEARLAELTKPAWLLGAGRVPVMLEAVRLLVQSATGLPVIANLVGPVSLAAALVQPTTLIKELRTRRETAHRLIGLITDFLIELGLALRQAGADVIVIHEDTGGSKIIGPRLFEEYTVFELNRLTDRLRAAGAPVIVHICSELESARSPRALIRCDAHSAEHAAELANLKQAHPQVVTMGGLATFLLDHGPAERIAGLAEKLSRERWVDILAPGCGLGLSTPLAHIRAMTRAATEEVEIAVVTGSGEDDE